MFTSGDIYETAAKGVIQYVGEETITVDFSEYASKMNYINLNNLKTVSKTQCVLED
jgi:hypothetical protein